MSGKFTMAGLAPILLSSCVAAQTPAPQPEPDPYAAWTEACEDWDEWDKPGPPFRVHGNTYYIGTCGIGAILVTNGVTGMLIDSGTEAGARVAERNIASVGFDLSDIILLGYSHEHFDHVGGMAYLQELTGARLVSLEAGAETMRSGASDPRDPQHGILDPFAPVEVIWTLPQGNRSTIPIGLGGLAAYPTPGHTPGATTWQWESCDDAGDCLTIVYADSLSAVASDDYRFSDHPEYVAEFRAGIARLAELDCDILLTPHPSASGMRQKLLDGDLTSGMDCVAYAADRLARLEERLAREAAQ